MSENRITYINGHIALSINGWLDDLSNLFDDVYFVIDKKTAKISLVRFSYNMQANEDMTGVEVKVTNNIKPEYVLTSSIDADKLSELVKKSFARGEFLTNSPDLYEYLGQLSLKLYNEHLKGSYIMLKELLSRSTSVILKDDIPIAAVKGADKNPFFMIEDRVTAPCLFVNYVNTDKYFCFYESLRNSLLDSDNDKNTDTNTSTTDNNKQLKYKFIFFSTDENLVALIDVTHNTNHFEITHVEIADDYNNLRDYVISNQNNLNAILNAALDSSKNSSSTSFIDFLD